MRGWVLCLAAVALIAACARHSGGPAVQPTDTAKAKRNFDSAFEKVLRDYPQSSGAAPDTATGEHDLVWPKKKPP